VDWLSSVSVTELGWRVQPVMMAFGDAESWTLVDRDAAVVEPVEAFLSHLHAVERQPYLARPIDPIVRGVNTFNVMFEIRIANLARTGLTVDMLVIRRWGHRHTQLSQLRADRLDTPPQTIRAVAMTLMIGDKPTD